MDYQKLKTYLLSKTQATLDFPFGDDVSVFRVKSKMFALVGQRAWKEKDTMMLNLKIDPDDSFIMRDIFSSITTGYHMSKKNWISIYFDGTVPSGEVERLIDDSYALVVKGLKKSDRASLELNASSDKLNS
jgi:predicted DNA-binding protein (MmcQ/YjbR family)